MVGLPARPRGSRGRSLAAAPLRRPWQSFACAVLWVGVRVVGGLQVELPKARAAKIPDRGGPLWGGGAFHDSPAAINPWSSGVPSLPGVREDLPEEPHFEGREQLSPPRHPDFVSPYDAPRAFPVEQRPEHAGIYDISAPVTPIENRRIVAPPDKLDSYPVVAPHSKITGEDPPVATPDEVLPEVGRYLNQQWDRHLKAMCGVADADNDYKITPAEMQETLTARLGMSAEDAQDLVTEMGMQNWEITLTSDCLRVLQAAYNSRKTTDSITTTAET